MRPSWSGRFVDLLVTALVTTSIGGCLIALATENFFDVFVGEPVGPVSLIAFLLLLPATLILVLLSHPRRRLALGGLLVAFPLIIWAFGLPRIT